MTVLEFFSTILQRNNYVSVSQARCKHNLINLIRTMPKLQTHAAALKKQRLKIKEKSAKYVPGTVNLQVLGSGAYGAPRSLYMFTDQSRYLFNCGEGTQRLAHEHKMKLAKLEHIFFTYGSWNNIGGLPGMSLTIQDVGIPEITLHGPQGIDDIFRAAKRFIVLNHLKINTSNYKEVDHFEDNVMRVNYVPLDIGEETSRSRRSEAVSLDRASAKQRQEAASSSGCSSGTEGDTTDDDIDYYAYEREPQPEVEAEQNGGAEAVEKKKKKKKKRSSSVDCEPKRRRLDAAVVVGTCAMSYVCRLHDRPGALLLERCVERGVPPGPLLGRLKAGHDVTLDNGTVVRSDDVTSPNEAGAVFIVVECPDERFLDALDKEQQFATHQADASCPEDVAFLVVHFSPPFIIKHPRYQSWMSRFHATTNHLIINESNQCKGSIAVHRIQTKLNLLDKRVFPLLPLDGVVVAPSDVTGDVTSTSSEEYLSAVTSLGSSSVTSSETSVTSSTVTGSSDGSQGAVIESKTFTTVHLRPTKHVDTGDKLMLDRAEYLKEALAEPDIEQVLLELDRQRGRVESGVDHQEYPSVVFLGTGSCIPNKARNTSGILVNISADRCMLLDCGEGTLGQLVRFHGAGRMRHVLRSLRAVYVSHLHADHHIGLIGLLNAWRSAHAQEEEDAQKLFLVAPRQIMSWLDHYDAHFERVMDGVQLVPNSDLLYNDFTLSPAVKSRLFGDLEMASIKTALVKHCPNAFGVAIEHQSGWKITYSGDTMFSTNLVEIGQNSTVLIHEATMGDDLAEEARRKMHSTTSEAIEAGRQMAAAHTILTHFSQRYATLPRIDANFTDAARSVGIAFDNMSVRLTDLPKLPLFYPALKLIFSEHMEEMNLRVFRREMKQLRAKDRVERDRLSS
ncbi:hypothetical protein LSTR_LSTR008632 [Laodelphax striatellus]|uniref:Zinc phosphodiesterase ELAC protein 2 n=1 Tax=Laodelphax striatellus TaxID=195883 RepID=A0A482WM37_LAOST|nr:hypothetical protein LSTR_LSTR008632 [Laodelphax striatellus]